MAGMASPRDWTENPMPLPPANGSAEARFWLLPLSQPSGNSVALVWSVPEARASEVLALAPEEFTARAGNHERGALGKLSLISARAAWPLQLARASRWCGPGWALAGDAAHSVHPLSGQGLNPAWPMQALANVLREREYWRSVGDEKLLRRYERRARPTCCCWAPRPTGCAAVCR